MQANVFTKVESHGKTEFVTEISTLRHVNIPHCPACRVRPVPRKGTKTLDPAGEIAGWETYCACGAKLVIIND